MVKSAISLSQNPGQLSALLKNNERIIKEEQREVIRSTLSMQFQENLSKINEMLSDCNVQEVIQAHIPFLKEYKDDSTLSVYINETS